MQFVANFIGFRIQINQTFFLISKTNVSWQKRPKKEKFLHTFFARFILS